MLKDSARIQAGCELGFRMDAARKLRVVRHTDFGRGVAYGARRWPGKGYWLRGGVGNEDPAA